MLEPIPREGKSPFIEGTRLQWAWDSTSLGILKECPKKYEYIILEGWRRQGESVHLFFGQLFHAGLELYARLRTEEATHEYACEEVVGFLLEKTWINGKPWESDNSKKTRETLLRSVVWYLEQYRDDTAHTFILANGKPAVELSFSFDMDASAPNGRKYVLSGHLDRLVEFDGTLFVMDHKTTGSSLGAFYFTEFNPHNQMSLYTLASRVVFNAPISGVIIDAAQIAVGFTAFARGITMRSEDQLDEWLRDTVEWLRLAEHYASSGHYPRNENSCHKFGGCQFRDVCAKSPSVRDNFLRAEFKQTDPWNPLKTR